MSISKEDSEKVGDNKPETLKKSAKLERLEILASRLDFSNKKSIQIHDYNEVNGVEYVKISYDGEVRNLMLHNTVYPYGESPYNQEINSVPYVVIKGDVYEIRSFVSVGYNDDDYRKTNK